jgi:Fusaric acid resistance protein-like
MAWPGPRLSNFGCATGTGCLRNDRGGHAWLQSHVWTAMSLRILPARLWRRLPHSSSPASCACPKLYWATISTIIVMQSTLGAALTISGQRFAGTVLGAAAGALLSTYFHSSVAIFGVGVFSLGLICAVLRVRTAYRFSAVTLAITMLIPRDGPGWVVAEYRFVEVSVGILAGLAITALWPTQAPRRTRR